MSKIKQVGNTTYLEETEKRNTFSNIANVSMDKELEIEELTELEVLADLECYALGSYELDNFETKEAQEHYDIIQKETKILKFALERKEKLEKFREIIKEKHQQYAFIRKYNITRYLREDLSYCANENDEELLTENQFNLLKEMLKNYS